MTLLRTAVGKKLLIAYLISICLAWKSASQMGFNSSSQVAFALWALGLLRGARFVPYRKERQLCCGERSKGTSTARTGGPKRERGGKKLRDDVGVEECVVHFSSLFQGLLSLYYL